MESKDNFSYKSFDTFIIRTPLLSFASVYNFLNNEESFTSLISNPFVKEAIYIASPVLYTETLKLIKGEFKEEKEKKKIIFALTKYLLRMSARCTPFGLFAGCSTGKIGNDNKIELLSKENYKKNVRLDMFYLCHLTKDLSKILSLKNQIKFYPNNSSYEVGDELRYVECRYQNNARSHHMVQVTASDYLKKILYGAENGSSIDSLANLIVDNEISFADAKTFVNELIDSQILINELEPKITGGDFLEQILKTFQSLKIRNEEINNIESILNKVKDKIDGKFYLQTGLSEDFYKSVIDLLNTLSPSLDKGKLFQLDLVKPTKISELTKDIYKDVSEAITVLSKLVRYRSNPNLEKFKETFIEKYQDDEIPLLIALDTEMGIGYPVYNSSTAEVLVDDIEIINNNAEPEIKWSRVQSYLLKKYIEAIKEKKFCVHINDDELKDFDNQIERLPDTLSAILSIIERDKETGKYLIHLTNAGGSGAASLLGRFCHADKNILELSRNITKVESELNQDALLAEVVHLPEPRVGNILQRPILRGYEIPYVARPAVEKDLQIEANDLMVVIINNRVVIKSKRLNKEIIPRLSTAHNYSMNALPVYQFLCDLQTQNVVPSVMFSWGVLSNEYKFLPRVLYKNILLHLATWNLSKNDFKEITEADEVSLNEAVIKWKENFSFPQFIALADDDNELVIDLDNLFCVKVFINEIKKRNNIRLVEFPFNKKNLLVNGPEGGFVNEFILSFYKTKHDENNLPVVNRAANKNKSVASAQRNYVPGEEWLYYKFYCGAKTSDEILTKVIKLVVSELLRNNVIDKWFFIRYLDPKNHLRVRLHFTDTNNLQGAINSIKLLIEPFIKNMLVWKIQVDTYQREIERYGEGLIEQAESLFFYDSEATLSILEVLGNSLSENNRWLVAIRSVDKFLSDFKFGLPEKEKFTLLRKNDFANEFGAGKNSKIHLSKKFRLHIALIKIVLDGKNAADTELRLLLSILDQRSSKNRSIANEIIAKCSKSELEEYLKSYIHMNVNRFFKSKQGLYEFVIYDFLNMYYKSEIAKLKIDHQN